MAKLSYLGNLQLNARPNKPVAGNTLVKAETLCCDVLGKVAIFYFQVVGRIKFFDALNTEKADLPVPHSGMGIAFNPCAV